MAVSLLQAGNAILYTSVPWSKRLVSLKVRSFPKGAIPAHLMSFLFAKGGDPATCARETIGSAGAARVHKMNACISRLRKRR